MDRQRGLHRPIREGQSDWEELVDHYAAAVSEITWLRATIDQAGFDIHEVATMTNQRAPGRLVQRGH